MSLLKEAQCHGGVDIVVERILIEATSVAVGHYPHPKNENENDEKEKTE